MGMFCYLFFMQINLAVLIIKFIITFLKNYWEPLVDICTIASPFIVAYYGSKYSKNQDNKINYDNKINRIANFQSMPTLNKNLKIILQHNEEKYNIEKLKCNKNALFIKDLDKINKFYLVEFIFYLNNFTKIYPNYIKIKGITINGFSKNENNEKIGFNIERQPIEYNYFLTPIDDTNLNIVKTYFCLKKEEFNNIYNIKNGYLPLYITINFTIKNSFGIETNNIVYGEYKQVGWRELEEEFGDEKKSLLTMNAENIEMRNIEIKEEKK